MTIVNNAVIIESDKHDPIDSQIIKFWNYLEHNNHNHNSSIEELVHETESLGDERCYHMLVQLFLLIEVYNIIKECNTVIVLVLAQ